MNTNNYKFIVTLLILLGFLTISFFVGRCSSPKEVKTETIKVSVPGVAGKSKIINNPVPYEVIKDSIIYKDSIVYQENQELIERFRKIESEKERLDAYMKSIELKKYDMPYEDENIKTNALITTRGDIISFEQKYEIKPRTIEAQIPVKEPKLAIYLGGGLINNAYFNNFAVEANIGIQNKKGDILSVGYDTQKNFKVGYSFRLGKK